jgi:nitroimidazol reductase NimA-like FMN-containing flavoprotein (pyridoxamine 5'-phosphate oxidase superfamily)/GNAT superfamily N-acetyltransferase
MERSRESSPASVLTPTPRTTHKRRAARGSHERALIDAILDEALVCHIGVSLLDGPYVLPTAHVRVGDFLYVHGARKNQLFTALLARPFCVTVTLLDGLVLARSAFHHSMNYRSVVLFGQANEVSEREEKRAALRALIEHTAAGRWHEVITPSDEELDATLVLRLPIAEGSAKVRSGPPLDATHELGRGIWAGELPLSLVASAPRSDGLDPATPVLSPAVRERAHALGARVPSDRPIDVPAVQAVFGAEEELLMSNDPARVDVSLVHGFLSRESYWAEGVSERAFVKSCAGSLCFGVYRGAQQLAFARVVTDFARFAYLADVFVVKELRGRGLGTALVREILAEPELLEIERWLLGTRDAHGLYAQLGFVPAGDGRYMVRNVSAATGPDDSSLSRCRRTNAARSS